MRYVKVLDLCFCSVSVIKEFCGVNGLKNVLLISTTLSILFKSVLVRKKTLPVDIKLI